MKSVPALKFNVEQRNSCCLSPQKAVVGPADKRIIGARLVSGYMCSLDQLNHSRVLQLPLCRGRKFQSRSPAQSPAAASMARARWATSQRTCSLWCFVRGTEAPRESACLWRSFFPSPKKGPLEQRLRTPGRKFCRLTF